MRNYLRLSRTHSYSLLFALPLLVLYEAGAEYLHAQGGVALRNGADVLLRTLLAATGVPGGVLLAVVLLGIGLVLVVLEQRRRRVRLRAGVFALMLLESTAYALVFGLVVGTATRWVLGAVPAVRLAADTGALAGLSLPEGVVLSLGAGFYEELVFRVLLVGTLAGIFGASGFDRRQAGIFAAVLAALLFSAFHYIGPFGDAWRAPSFLFRFLAGLVFSALFLLRGFGITAWTHALYDIFLLLARGP
jgi:membrane protease YdiL (CAAX protease family)